MAECNCNCPECTCDETQELNYTVKELNEILADGIINASVRYTSCKGTYIPLTLADALLLVPDKDKQVTKILTFMNKDEEPKPEIWIFHGKSVLDWLNPEYWTNIPIPSVSGLNKYLVSTSVRGIEVTEKAQYKKDNIMYFEYEPLPQKSEYAFYANVKDDLIQNLPVLVDVTLETTYIGENGLNRVNILFGSSSKPLDSHISFSAIDSLGVKHEFVDQGYWGPPQGFDLPAEYSATTEWTLVFSNPGDYDIYYKLIDVASGRTIVESSTKVTVK